MINSTDGRTCHRRWPAPIVVYDTLIKDLEGDVPMIKAVVGHEIGHSASVLVQWLVRLQSRAEELECFVKKISLGEVALIFQFWVYWSDTMARSGHSYFVR